MIDIVNVWHHYGIRPVLKNISLHVETGELMAIMGPNGMGKSTLLGLMAGVLWPIEGSVVIDGHKRRNSVEEEIEIRKKVIYLPDNPFLPMLATGREFALAMGRLYEVEEQRLMEHIEQLLSIFDLEKQADSLIRTYSMGQKKKISICATMITEAPIMILDEPFSGGLDTAALLALSKILKRLAERKDITVVMAVPVTELIEPLAHKIAIVADGQIVACDTPEGLQRTTGTKGDLTEIFAKLIQPKVLDRVEQYLTRRIS
jgi:ABC-2 type transport system ATP-binding protein